MAFEIHQAEKIVSLELLQSSLRISGMSLRRWTHDAVASGYLESSTLATQHVGVLDARRLAYAYRMVEQRVCVNRLEALQVAFITPLEKLPILFATEFDTFVTLHQMRSEIAGLRAEVAELKSQLEHQFTSQLQPAE